MNFNLDTTLIITIQTGVCFSLGTLVSTEQNGDTQYYNTQHNDAQHLDAQHNDIPINGTQNYKKGTLVKRYAELVVPSAINARYCNGANHADCWSCSYSKLSPLY